MKKYREIRLDDKGKLDDIVIDDVSVHLERMTNNIWWLGIYKGKKAINFNIISGRRIDVFVQDDELKVKVVPNK